VCLCPNWALGCTFSGEFDNSTIKNLQVKNILDGKRPKFCSIEEYARDCGNAEFVELNQIELYDKTLHFIENMDIISSFEQISLPCGLDWSDQEII
jgi:hypothetical protein